MKLQFSKQNISDKHLAVFTRQLGVLLESKLTLLNALNVMLQEESVLFMREILGHLICEVESGCMLSSALENYPKVFDSVYINMVKAGEESNALGSILIRLAEYRQKAVGFRRKVKSALVYPSIVLSVVVFVVSVLLIYVIPKFGEMFQNVLDGQSLPLLTRVLVGFGQWMQDNFMYVGAFMVFGLSFLVLIKRKYGFASFVLKIPKLRQWAIKVSLSQFTRSMSLLLRGEVSVYQALKISRNTIQNPKIAQSIDLVCEKLLGGESLVKSFSEDPIFPPLLVSMVKVGEETDTLEEMLGAVADAYEEDIGYLTADVVKLIEPFMILILAVLVGTIVFALFLPIMTLIEQLIL